MSKFQEIYKVEFDMSNYPTKSTLTTLKVKSDEIDICKRKTVPADLNELSHVVDNGVVKNPVYDKLVSKINTIIKNNTIHTKVPSTSR